MENNTLAFFIGVQNLCITHNKSITSLQWMMGNAFVVVAFGLSIWLYMYITKKQPLLKKMQKVIIFSWVFIGVFFLTFNAVSLSMPIDEREVMEEILEKKPELAKQVRYELNNLKNLGSDFEK